MIHGLPLYLGAAVSIAAVSPAFTAQAASEFPNISSRTQQADSTAEPALFEVSHEVDFDVAFALGDLEAPADPPFADLRYRAEAEAVRASGLRWGARLELGAVRHDGGRGAGGLVRCTAGCPPLGLATGLAPAPGFGTAEPRAGLGRAELYLSHPYAELRAGHIGTAAVLEAPDRVRAFRLAGADGGLIDPIGFNLADTGLSLTAAASGVSIQSRRLAGFRAALSYVIDADPCGLDHCRPSAAGAAPELGEVWSAALSFDRRDRSTGVRWAAFAGAERAGLEGPKLAAYEAAHVTRLSVLREAGGVTLSARWLASNDGLSGGRYEAAGLTAAIEAGAWLYSLEAGRGSSDAYDIHSTTFFFGASRLIGRNALAGAGVQMTNHDRKSGGEETAAALILEAGLRF